MKIQLIAAAAALVFGATAAHAQQEWYRWHGGACPSTDLSKINDVKLKTDGYVEGRMISPDSAKVVALCAVPGQIGSGELKTVDGRPQYAIQIIPNGKQVNTEVIVDAKTGYVLSSKQFGGLRGKVGWIRESLEHKKG